MTETAPRFNKNESYGGRERGRRKGEGFEVDSKEILADLCSVARFKRSIGGGGAIRVPLGSDQTVFPPLLAILGPVENRAHACSVSEIMTMS